MKRTGLWILTIALLLGGAVKLLYAPPWNPVTPFTGAGPLTAWWLYGMDQGGVAEDIQVIYPVGTTGSNAKDVVWTACMNGGFYRSVWNNGWGDWDMNLPAKKAYGLDVIRINEGGVAKECVLCASTNLGLRYTKSTQDNFAANWDWPHGLGEYPRLWYQAGTHDAAFYLPQNDSSPQDSFFVILSYNLGDYNAGIYRWDNVYEDFTRVDEPNPWSTPHSYGHFYRDVNNKNVLYVTSPDGIYKLSGHYGREMFVKLPEGTRLEDLPVLLPQDIKGFDQLVKHFQK